MTSRDEGYMMWPLYEQLSDPFDFASLCHDIIVCE